MFIIEWITQLSSDSDSMVQELQGRTASYTSRGAGSPAHCMSCVELGYSSGVNVSVMHAEDMDMDRSLLTRNHHSIERNNAAR